MTKAIVQPIHTEKEARIAAVAVELEELKREGVDVRIDARRLVELEDLGVVVDLTTGRPAFVIGGDQ